MKKNFLVMVLVLFVSFNTNATVTSGNCGPKINDEYSNSCTYSYDSLSKTLTILGSGQMASWGEVGMSDDEEEVAKTERPWHDISSEVETVRISGVSNVGSLAFHKSSALKNIIIEDSVETIGLSAFYADNAVQSLTFSPDSKLVEIYPWAFSGLSTTSLILPDSLQSIGKGVFEGMNQLTSLVIPDGASVGSLAFIRASGKIYCTSNTDCVTDTSVNPADVVTYAKDKSGLFALTDENGDILEDTNGNPIYYLSANDMTAQSNACLGGYQTCAEQALHNKALALLEKGTVCQTLEMCQALVNTDYNGDVIKLGGKDYASLTDLLKGNTMPKRIYTIEEANAVAKPTGNTVRIKYR